MSQFADILHTNLRDLYNRPGFIFSRSKRALCIFGYVICDHHALGTFQGKQQGQTDERDSLSNVSMELMDCSTAADSDFSPMHSIHTFDILQSSMQSYHKLLSELNMSTTTEDIRKQLDKLALTFGRVYLSSK